MFFSYMYHDLYAIILETLNKITGNIKTIGVKYDDVSVCSLSFILSDHFEYAFELKTSIYYTY